MQGHDPIGTPCPNHTPWKREAVRPERPREIGNKIGCRLRGPFLAQLSSIKCENTLAKAVLRTDLASKSFKERLVELEALCLEGSLQPRPQQSAARR